jgi:16S rRNA G966 N2-methylase RsmD
MYKPDGADQKFMRTLPDLVFFSALAKWERSRIVALQSARLISVEAISRYAANVTLTDAGRAALGRTKEPVA